MKVAIVNATRSTAEALRRIVNQEHEVIWVAHSGAQALQFCAENHPDLVLMGLVMPEMDGVETTRRIMGSTPCAILVVTLWPEQSTSQVFRALGAGALDVVAMPALADPQAGSAVLLKKMKTIGTLIAASRSPLPSRQTEVGAMAASAPVDTLVAIGASTGGPVALAKLLGTWSPPSNCAVVIVQHIDRDFADSFAQWLGAGVKAPVSVIEEGTVLAPGQVFLAKTNHHLVLGPGHRLSYSAEPLDYPYRPSVDVFFCSVARHWGAHAIGVLLTGMGRDGAQGLLAMRQAGSLTIAQDEASSAVYGMPRAAAQMKAAVQILPLTHIGPALLAETEGRARVQR